MTENAEATANTNPAPESAPVAPSEPAQAPAPEQSPQLNLTTEQAEQWNKFVSANGGFDSAFSKLKSAVSNPQPKVEEPTQAVSAETSQVQQQPVQQEAPKMPNGYASAQELFIESYFKGLAADDKYKAIADEISSGEVLKKMQQEFGINAVNEYGQVNVAQVKNYLDMYAATKPTASTGVEPTNIPTVDYLDITSVNSRDDALAIMAQTREAQAKGLAAHPKFEEAKKFLQDSIFGAK